MFVDLLIISFIELFIGVPVKPHLYLAFILLQAILIFDLVNFVKILKSFTNCKYTWGGKSYKGIDCSALVQLYYLYNNKFFPRDTKDQISFKKGKKKLIKFSKGDIIYWKGHVALALSNKKLIHAYGPLKKTVVMGINQTIKRIQQTAKLKVIGIKRI